MKNRTERAPSRLRGDLYFTVVTSTHGLYGLVWPDRNQCRGLYGPYALVWPMWTVWPLWPLVDNAVSCGTRCGLMETSTVGYMTYVPWVACYVYGLYMACIWRVYGLHVA